MHRIAIIEDDPVLKASITDFFTKSEHIECILAVDTIEKFIKFHRDFLDIQLLLLDINLHEQSSIPDIPRLKQLLPEAEIIMFTIADDYDTVFQAICSGATGYLLKDITLQALETQLVFVLEGNGALLSPAVARRMIQYFKLGHTAATASHVTSNLTDKEKPIVTLLRDGYSYDEIARHLGITKDGVRYHVKNIYKKLNISNRGELLRKIH